MAVNTPIQGARLGVIVIVAHDHLVIVIVAQNKSFCVASRLSQLRFQICNLNVQVVLLTLSCVQCFVSRAVNV